MNREIKKIVDYNCEALEKSDATFKSIYEVMFRFTDNILAETNDGYRIRKYTYGEIKKRIEEVSFAIHQRIGATHEYIGLEMENCIEWIISFWAILRSGNKPYLINCRHPRELCNGILKSLKVKYIIGLGTTALEGEFIDFSELTGKGEFVGEFEDEIALSTSATTLNEVVCFYTGREMTCQLMNTKGILKNSDNISKHYKGSLKQLAFLPFYHIFGLVAVYFWFTYFGRTLVFLKDYSPDTIIYTINKHEVTHIFAVPMLWHTIEDRVMKEVRSGGDKTVKKFNKGLKLCTRLQTVFPNAGISMSKRIMKEVTGKLFGKSVLFCISGGSYLRKSALALFNGIGYPLHNGYGMSEIGITSVELSTAISVRNKGLIGKPFDSVTYSLSDKGILSVKGASICHRIMKNGTVSEVEEWFETGDILEKQQEGYYICGRMGDAVIGENGENINPDIIEQNFDVTGTEGFCVLGIKKGESEILTMIVKIGKYTSEKTVNAFIERFINENDRLPMTQRVKEFYFTYDEISAQNAIKVGRAYLLRQLSLGRIKLMPFSEMRNFGENKKSELSKVAVKVREIVAGELSIEPEKVGLDEHIITSLGASSLQYFAMVGKMAGEFKITAQLKENEYKYTVREISEYIEEQL